MKIRHFLTAGFALCSFMLLQAQAVEITPTYGYQLGGRLNYAGGYLRVDDSDMLGITAGYELQTDLMVEVTYMYMGTELRIRDAFIPEAIVETRLSDLNADWFMLGGTRYFGDDRVKPFLGGQLGFAVFTPNNVDSNIVPRGLNSITKFSFGFKGGVVVMISDTVGINLQGNLLFPVQWGGFFIGAGPGGAGGGVTAGTTIVMGAFSGGLVFRLGS